MAGRWLSMPIVLLENIEFSTVISLLHLEYITVFRRYDPRLGVTAHQHHVRSEVIFLRPDAPVKVTSLTILIRRKPSISTPPPPRPSPFCTPAPSYSACGNARVPRFIINAVYVVVTMRSSWTRHPRSQIDNSRYLY